jgi:hypothetical protein
MSRLGVPSLRYIRANEVWQYVHEHPGVTARQVTDYFKGDVRPTMYVLLSQGRLIRTKQGVWRWYAQAVQAAQKGGGVDQRQTNKLTKKGGE